MAVQALKVLKGGGELEAESVILFQERLQGVEKEIANGDVEMKRNYGSCARFRRRCVRESRAEKQPR